jgi:hypothetical protein
MVPIKDVERVRNKELGGGGILEYVKTHFAIVKFSIDLKLKNFCF